MNIKTNKNDIEFTPTPSAGYFFVNNFAAGSEFSLSFQKHKEVNTNVFQTVSFARNYLYLKNSSFKPLRHQGN